MSKKILFFILCLVSISGFAQVAPPTSLPPRPQGSLEELPGLPVFNNQTMIKNLAKEQEIKKKQAVVPPKKDEDFAYTGNVVNDLYLFKPPRYYTDGQLNNLGLEVKQKSRDFALSKEVAPAIVQCQREIVLLVRESMATPGLFEWSFYQHPNYGAYLRSKVSTRSAFDGNHEFDFICAVESHPSGLWIMNKKKFNNGLFIVRDY